MDLYNLPQDLEMDKEEDESPNAAQTPEESKSSPSAMHETAQITPEFIKKINEKRQENLRLEDEKTQAQTPDISQLADSDSDREDLQIEEVKADSNFDMMSATFGGVGDQTDA